MRDLELKLHGWDNILWASYVICSYFLEPQLHLNASHGESNWHFGLSAAALRSRCPHTSEEPHTVFNLADLLSMAGEPTT